MYFDYRGNEDDSDDEIYQGVLPSTKIFDETKCKMCKRREQEWGDMSKVELLTKKQFNKWKKKFYWDIIEAKLLGCTVDMLASIYPKPLNNYLILSFMLKDDYSPKAMNIKEKIRIISELDQEIEHEQHMVDRALQKKEFMNKIINMVNEKRERDKEEKMKSVVTEEAIQLRKHLCDPRCVFCQTHCKDPVFEHPLKGKLCDCKCLVFDQFPC